METESKMDCPALVPVADMANAGSDAFAALVEWFCSDQVELRRRLAITGMKMMKGGHDGQG